MEIWLIWIIAALVLLVVELATTAVAALCLMIGCIVAAVPAFFDASLWWQTAAFVLASLLSFVFIRPIIMNHLMKGKSGGRKSGVQALIGREAIVAETIDAQKGTGRVIIDGDDWKAVSDMVIDKGQKVIVKSIGSIILTVTPKY